MLEKPNIQSTGFMNVYENGKAIGFQVLLRTTYYRGVFLSQIQKHFEVRVGWEVFKEDQVKITTGGKTYEQKDFASLSNVYWPIDEACILTVNKPGGLSPGIHQVQVRYANTVCYTSPETDLQWKDYTRTMTLVR